MFIIRVGILTHILTHYVQLYVLLIKLYTKKSDYYVCVEVCSDLLDPKLNSSDTKYDGCKVSTYT